jgi:hypothetical protein
MLSDVLKFCTPMTYWEVIADNLKKTRWSLGYVSAIDSARSERSGLLTRTARAMEGALLCMVRLPLALSAAKHIGQRGEHLRRSARFHSVIGLLA